MKLNSGLVAATALLLSGTFAQAGWSWNKQRYEAAKTAMVEQRVTSPSYCFDKGWEFSFFGSGIWLNNPNPGSANQFGAGGALSYFFGHNLGLEGSYSAHGGTQSEQIGKTNLVYRFPLGGECCSTIAPYVFGGVGVISSGPSEFLWNVGGGIDWRLESWGCIGMFADYSYNGVNGNFIPDFTQLRVGFRVPF